MPLPNTPVPGLTPATGITGLVSTLPAEVIRGRETDREAVAKMLSQEWVRAGLVVGEIGIGKSAFLRLGLIPYLRETGAVPLVCEDPRSPTQAFAQAASVAAGVGARLDERPLDYLVRIVGSTLSGKIVIFLLDDLDLALRNDPEGKLVHEMGDLLSRVCGRPGGKARFLFTAADSRMHLADALERRTGSLFPITSRYTLGRLTVAQAADALADLLGQDRVPRDPDLPRAVAEGLSADTTQAHAAGILPVDLEFSASAIRHLAIRSGADLARAGGTGELEQRWIEDAAQRTGDRGAAMRLLSELSVSDGSPVAPDDLGRKAATSADFAAHALGKFREHGLVAAIPGATPEWPSYVLAHEALAPRLRLQTAAAVESTRRARAVLAAAAQRGGRLSRADHKFILREQLPPSSPEEAAVLSRTQRRIKLLKIAAVAIPALIIIGAYVSLVGSRHVGVERQRGAERLVVRSGTPGLRMFWWLPPGFGDTVADTGVTPAMVPAAEWKKLDGASIASGDGQVARVHAALHPRLRLLLRYAAKPSDEAPLAELTKTVATPEDWLSLLAGLEPLAKGGQGEVNLVKQATGEPTLAVQAAALTFAARVEERHPGPYRQVLAEALGGADATLRRQAVAAVRAFPRERQSEIYALALSVAKEPAARQQVLAALAAHPDVPAAAGAEAAVAILSDAAADDTLRSTGWSMLGRAFDKDPAVTARAAARMLSDGAASEDTQRQVLQLLEDKAPKEAFADIATAVEVAATSTSPRLRAEALPLYARLSPTAALRHLELKSDSPPELRAAQAQGWGELAKESPAAVQGALDMLLKDSSTKVRAAAARAYGKMGRASLSRLSKLVKEGGDVSEGAAFGFAAAVEAGANAGDAVSGIGQLWKDKGPRKKIAARAYARIARSKPGAVVGRLAEAARDKDDGALRVIGVDGLCAALAAGADKTAGAALDAAAAGEYADARARVAACLDSHPDKADVILKAVPDLVRADDAGTRAAAARAFTAAVPVLLQDPKAKVRPYADDLIRLVGDPDRSVRLAALGGLTALGNKAPAKEAGQALRAQIAKAGGEEEKLAILDAAAAVEDDSAARHAALDTSPAVRQRALGTAVTLKADVLGALQRGLADREPSVRREAIKLLGRPSTLVSEADSLRLLEAAIRDVDPEVAGDALVLLGSIDDPVRFSARVRAGFAAASEREREWSARAALGLAARDPALAAKALEPALADRAHDVREEVVPALAAAWAQSRPAKDLAAVLRNSETDSMRRLTAAWALYLQAKGKEPDAAKAALAAASKDAPAWGKWQAALVASLVANEADGPRFLSTIVP